jgi:hypothetical protein
MRGFITFPYTTKEAWGGKIIFCHEQKGAGGRNKEMAFGRLHMICSSNLKSIQYKKC